MIKVSLIKVCSSINLVHYDQKAETVIKPESGCILVIKDYAFCSLNLSFYRTKLEGISTPIGLEIDVSFFGVIRKVSRKTSPSEVIAWLASSRSPWSVSDGWKDEVEINIQLEVGYNIEISWDHKINESPVLNYLSLSSSS